MCYCFGTGRSFSNHFSYSQRTLMHGIVQCYWRYIDYIRHLSFMWQKLALSLSLSSRLYVYPLLACLFWVQCCGQYSPFLREKTALEKKIWLWIDKFQFYIQILAPVAQLEKRWTLQVVGSNPTWSLNSYHCFSWQGRGWEVAVSFWLELL